MARDGLRPGGRYEFGLNRWRAEVSSLVEPDTPLTSWPRPGLGVLAVRRPRTNRGLADRPGSSNDDGVIIWPSPHRVRGNLPRKEVIQPQLPLRLPCYDFVPVASPTFGGCVPKVRAPTSSVTHSHDVTGGVYKARERIHRSMADLRLLATPASSRRVSACYPNWGRF